MECTELSGYVHTANLNAIFFSFCSNPNFVRVFMIYLKMQPILAVRVNWEQPGSDPREQHRNMTSTAAPCERKPKKTAVSIYGLLYRELLADVIEERDEYKDAPIVSSSFLSNSDCFC